MPEGVVSGWLSTTRHALTPLGARKAKGPRRRRVIRRHPQKCIAMHFDHEVPVGLSPNRNSSFNAACSANSTLPPR